MQKQLELKEERCMDMRKELERMKKVRRKTNKGKESDTLERRDVKGKKRQGGVDNGWKKNIDIIILEHAHRAFCI